MTKTGTQVEHDIFMAVKSPVKDLINGDVYNSTGRPTDSTKEDAVVMFLTGRDAQIQEGVVIVNIFVPDIYPDGQKGRSVKDTKRCREIEAGLLEIAEDLKLTEYHLSRSEMIQSFKHQERDEHFINARLNFKRIIN